MGKRAELILDFTASAGATSYKDLTKFLGVSVMTVRRECDELFRKGKVIKTVGGVQRVNGAVEFYEKTADQRMAANALEKRAIARKGLELINKTCAIFIDGSTTGPALAEMVDAERQGLTIVNHSALICLALTSGRNTIICAGGEFEPRSRCFVGPQTQSFARSVFVDLAFFSTTGFLTNDGTYESEPATFRIKQEIADRADEVVLLVDHTKFGRRALNKVLDLSTINHVVTDSQTSEAEIAEMVNSGIKVSSAHVRTTFRL